MKAVIGQLFHEGNSFNPLTTEARDFVVHRGPDVLQALRGSGTILGGIIAELESAGADLVPSIAASARPGGPVEHGLFEDFTAEILSTAERATPTMVVLELHGAMTTTKTSDAEGLLLARLREALGPEVVIAVGLDLHGLVTERMLTHADILTACKHNPHSDYVEAGATAARLAVAKHRGTQRPVTVACRLPMLLAGNMDTSSGPLQAAHRLARERCSKNPGLLDISIFNVIPLLDAPEMGQVVLAITDNEPQAGIQTTREIAELLWRRRSEFRDNFPSLDTALDRVVSEKAMRPFVLADFGDRVLAGAPGDSTDILAALMRRGDALKVALPVTDPSSVARAQAAGLGAKVELSVGGCYTPITPPVTVTVTVRHLSDGRFVMKGPFLAGQETSMGDTAVVTFGSITLLLTAGSAMTQDVNCFESQGICVAEQDVIVTKSGYHFELSFAGIATPLKVETKGLGVYRPGRFRVRRPALYPEVDPGEIVIAPAVIA